MKNTGSEIDMLISTKDVEKLKKVGESLSSAVGGLRGLSNELSKIKRTFSGITDFRKTIKSIEDMSSAMYSFSRSFNSIFKEIGKLESRMAKMTTTAINAANAAALTANSGKSTKVEPSGDEKITASSLNKSMGFGAALGETRTRGLLSQDIYDAETLKQQIAAIQRAAANNVKLDIITEQEYQELLKALAVTEKLEQTGRNRAERAAIKADPSIEANLQASERSLEIMKLEIQLSKMGDANERQKLLLQEQVRQAKALLLKDIRDELAGNKNLTTEQRVQLEVQKQILQTELAKIKAHAQQNTKASAEVGELTTLQAQNAELDRKNKLKGKSEVAQQKMTAGVSAEEREQRKIVMQQQMQDQLLNAQIKKEIMVEQLTKEQAEIEQRIAALKAQMVGKGTKDQQRDLKMMNNELRNNALALSQVSRQYITGAQSGTSYYNTQFQLIQVLREAPNFLISVQTGVLSLSNNLPTLITGFYDARRAAGSWMGALKSMVGPMLVINLAAVAITMIFMQLPKLLKMLKNGFFDMGEVLDNVSKGFKDMSSEGAKNIEMFINLRANLSNVNEGIFKDGQKYLDEYNEKFGKTLGIAKSTEEAYRNLDKASGEFYKNQISRMINAEIMKQATDEIGKEISKEIEARGFFGRMWNGKNMGNAIKDMPIVKLFDEIDGKSDEEAQKIIDKNEDLVDKVIESRVEAARRMRTDPLSAVVSDSFLAPILDYPAAQLEIALEKLKKRDMKTLREWIKIERDEAQKILKDEGLTKRLENIYKNAEAAASMFAVEDMIDPKKDDGGPSGGGISKIAEKEYRDRNVVEKEYSDKRLQLVQENAVLELKIKNKAYNTEGQMLEDRAEAYNKFYDNAHEIQRIDFTIASQNSFNQAKKQVDDIREDIRVKRKELADMEAELAKQNGKATNDKEREQYNENAKNVEKTRANLARFIEQQEENITTIQRNELFKRRVLFDNYVEDFLNTEVERLERLEDLFRADLEGKLKDEKMAYDERIKAMEKYYKRVEIVQRNNPFATTDDQKDEHKGRISGAGIGIGARLASGLAGVSSPQNPFADTAALFMEREQYKEREALLTNYKEEVNSAYTEMIKKVEEMAEVGKITDDQLMAFAKDYGATVEANEKKIGKSREEAAEAGVSATLQMLGHLQQYEGASIKERTKMNLEHKDTMVAITDELGTLTAMQSEKSLKMTEANKEALMNMAMEVMGAFNDLVSALYERSEELQARRNKKYLKEQTEMNESGYKSQTKTQEEYEAKKAAIQAEGEKRDVELQRRTAERERKQAIAELWIRAAMAALFALATPQGASTFGAYAASYAALATAAATAGTATILSQPLPEYAEGTEFHEGGAAIVGDGGKHEYITKGNKLVGITPAEPTMMNLDRGVKVYKDFDTFKDKSGIFEDNRMVVNVNNEELVYLQGKTNRLLSSINRKTSRHRYRNSNRMNL